MKIIAIDPGNIESAIVLIDEDLKPLEIGKYVNENVRAELRRNIEKYGSELKIAIEMVACYGMAVGKSVFETCVWIGRFKELAEQYNHDVTYIYRGNAKLNLCNSLRAKDSNVIQALIDRFAPNTSNKGKGSKKNPGWFYGFSKDIWQAYAVGITYYDTVLYKGE